MTPVAAKFRLRIAQSEDESRVGQEFELVDAATIGRERTSTVVLNEPTVSRRHARVEQTPTGLKLSDLGSGNGVWVGEERVSEIILQPGQQFRVGSTVLECRTVNGHVETEPEDKTVLMALPVLMPPAPAEPTHAPLADRIELRVIEAGEVVTTGTEFAFDGRSAVLGRARECQICLEERDISRRHAEITLVPGGLRVADLGSSGGTWIGDRQVTNEVLPPGGRVRLGSRLVLEFVTAGVAAPPAPDADVATGFMSIPEAFRSAVSANTAFMPASAFESVRAFDRSDAPVVDAAALAPANQADFDQSIVMPSLPVVQTSRGLEEEGELVEVNAQKPFLLDDPDTVYFVTSGGVLVFTIPIEKGEPVGIRTHFLGVVERQCLFGFDLSGHATGFLAVGRPGTTLRKISIARFRELAAAPAHAATIAGIVDTWVAGLSKSLLRDFISKQGVEQVLKPGETVSLNIDARATASEGVLWVDISSRSVLFDELAMPDFDRRHALFPLTKESWLQPVSAEFGEISVRPIPTAALVGSPGLWYGLGVFHAVVCECEFISKKLRALDEYERQLEKARHAQAAERAGYDAIGAVIRGTSETPREFLESAAAEPVFRGCQLVGAFLNMPVKQHPTAAEENLTYEEQVNAVASASAFRTRAVALRDDWYNYDHGPLLGMVEATKEPVALLPTSPRSYDLVNAKTGARTRVTEQVASTLSGFGYTFYRPFPPGEVSVTQLVKFGALGIGSDMKLVGLMSVIVGMFGTVTPYFTGQIFDAAIPQAERSMLIGFGLALVGSALATALFKTVQGIATVRLQSKMDYGIQAAVWDRVLNLPTTFFRKYSAGDLADRAAGVDAIRGLVSGAGVAAILGSVSGLFYVVQMFTYSLKMAGTAVGLTLIFVIVNWLGNYLQLTTARSVTQLQGRIAGLVLNLITGVNKLRVTGAEQHAFRVWAQQFATQKGISLRNSLVQAGMMVFSGIFPVISSMALFTVMIWEMQTAAESGARPLTTGEFIAFNTCYGLFLAAMQALGDSSMSLLKIVPIYERLKPILMTPPEVDPSRAFPGKLTGEIELSHVSFRYAEDGPWIIRDLSLKIKAGEFVAFVGGSGCGKSTLMRLMLGFEKPSSGAIYFDGQDMNSLDVRLVRQQMGVVLQVSRVMPTEIYRNITGTSSRTIEDAWDAAEKAGLAEDIRNMPMGMHTYVSEGGGTLSGGQRQRLLIARAIVNKPKILFLDEATSALDNRAQAMVSESMERMSATRVVIAHRLSTIINANKICYLEQGRIAEMGTNEELMAKGGLFAQLALRQVV
ncbi:MAG: NHLP bacteriocin export ABC transporter permease/ATPase subunit [Vicinamibacterales bacterium]